ncbi:MAG: hypothetical protein EBR82_87685 [Caulobacteraceae bacterium]|nr:hypothetical protein [Caulobacteraceae bacterium]
MDGATPLTPFRNERVLVINYDGYFTFHSFNFRTRFLKTIISLKRCFVIFNFALSPSVERIIIQPATILLIQRLMQIAVIIRSAFRHVFFVELSHNVFPFDGAVVTIAFAAERAAASILSSVSCDTLENLCARLFAAKSRMNFLTWDCFVRLFIRVIFLG